MRFRFSSLPCLALPFVLAACGDNAPVYPPIVIIEVGASVGGSGNGNGNSNGNGTSTGGSSSNGGSGLGVGGSATTGGDPLYAHCAPFASAPPPAVKTACDMGALTDGGDLTGDIKADRTLKSGSFYTLKGVVRVFSGKKLTIEPCVKVIGEDPNAVLVTLSSSLGDPEMTCGYSGGSVTPSGQLIAVGEPMAPIVFTSAKPVGQRAPGDWGGVLLLGNAHNNLATDGGQVPIEGLERAECHGYWTDEYNDDSSGHLEYVRIEYASKQISPDNETNGLTFGSVGSGTEIHYVEVSNSGDDCFEWFGGAVNADHLIGVNCDDDVFDVDNGFSGKLQFLFGRQFASTNEDTTRGFEISNGKAQITAFQTSVGISNFTLCGGGPADMTPRQRVGMYVEQTTQASLQNGLVTGFKSGGLDVQNGATPSITNARIFSEQPVALNNAPFLGQSGNSTEDPDRFCDCWTNPPAPVAASPIAGASPDGFPDAKAAYLGAFASDAPASNWMTGLWVDWNYK